MDDLNLALALLSRDSWAAKEAWVRFRPMVRGIVVRGLGRDAEIEDLTQEIFCRLFARIGTLQKPEALRQFVASFAIRIVKWEHRKRAVRRRITLTPTGTIADGPSDDPPRLDFFDAWRLCDRLVARERDVMLLRHLEGMTCPEIAQTLGVSVATVKRSLRVAELHLAGLLPAR